jgi:hypothetical protein
MDAHVRQTAASKEGGLLQRYGGPPCCTKMEESQQYVAQEAPRGAIGAAPVGSGSSFSHGWAVTLT